MHIAFSSEPVPGSEINEDFVAATASSVVVLDGASVPDGLEVGCKHGTRWFVERLGIELLRQAVSSSVSLPDVLARAIDRVRGLHESTCDLRHPGTPSSTVAAIRERHGKLDYLVLADSTLLLESSGRLDVLTDDRINSIDVMAGAAAARHPIGSRESQEHWFTKAARLREFRNQADGFWVASTHPEAAFNAISGTVEQASVRRAAILTDGATRLADRFGVIGWRELLDILDDRGPDTLIRMTRDAENEDSQGTRWPRTKRHDDATAVFCRPDSAT